MHYPMKRMAVLLQRAATATGENAARGEEEKWTEELWMPMPPVNMPVPATTQESCGRRCEWEGAGCMQIIPRASTGEWGNKDTPGA
ncbi:hypothetical protein NDU88_004689 [Pleurodeles waltl]|uniref:Uncharacterized protein n=1 Tax=Pleurodeles waltl TaxID=8319 RepID=A0AAV7SJL6_PLEWA|nr:hypothetical protein NDU88_004689 [Pleurodeles waltl]